MRLREWFRTDRDRESNDRCALRGVMLLVVAAVGAAVVLPASSSAHDDVEFTGSKECPNDNHGHVCFWSSVGGGGAELRVMHDNSPASEIRCIEPGDCDEPFYLVKNRFTDRKVAVYSAYGRAGCVNPGQNGYFRTVPPLHRFEVGRDGSRCG